MSASDSCPTGVCLHERLLLSRCWSLLIMGGSYQLHIAPWMPIERRLRPTSHMSQEPWPWPWHSESPKEKKKRCPKAVPTHFQNHAVWSWARECSGKLATCDRAGNQMLFPWLSIRAGSFVSGPTFERWFLNIIQVTMRHYPLDPM